MPSSLQLTISARPIELVEAVLEARGAHAVTVRGAGGETLIEPQPGDMPLWADAELTALFPPDTDAEAIVAAVAKVAHEPPSWHAELLEDRDWVRAWMDELQPLHVGHGLWVYPRHREVDEPGATVVRLDPGVAFGTGGHATTAMCLEWLADNPPRGCTVIDYGCGSGILAITAALLGAVDVRAVDVDPQAVRATRENAADNGVAARILSGPPDTVSSARADIVLANILAGPLIELAPTLARLTAPGGTLILTGLLARQAAEVADAYRPWFELTVDAERDDWVRLAGPKKTA